jgi:hypothetical protein
VFKPDREQGFAKAALDLMGECQVLSTPENFEFFSMLSRQAKIPPSLR